jgi:hypothetical protein
MASVRFNNQEVSGRDLSRAMLTVARADRRAKAAANAKLDRIVRREVEVELAYVQAQRKAA